MKAIPDVFVVGGGFAGLQAVKALTRRRPRARITLVDSNPYATMLPALPDVLSGRINRNALIRPFNEIISPRRVRVLTDEVTSVDAPRRTIYGRQQSYRYDYLILTSGSTPRYYGFAPLKGQLHSVHSYGAANALRNAVVEQVRSTARCSLVVVGAGYTGLEVAASLHHGLAPNGVQFQITVIEVADEILPFLKPTERQAAREFFGSIGVDLRSGVSLQRYADGTAELSDGTRVENALVCWAAGMQAECHNLTGTVERTEDGRLGTNDYLQLPAHPEVFVAGDAADLHKGDRSVRRAVNFAYYSGRTAGRNVAARLAGRPLRAFRPVDLGWVIPLGGISWGRIFGGIPVGGRFGLRLHYAMAGFRHFGAADAVEFYKTAFNLSRRPDPILP
ncbi:MAG: hypothetical protein EA384_11645 [Spirochaetaceae bacterium]|nr:MAG: hypothetical protein EA384_11645 [Spirochaetaceae bacterium]